MAALQQNCSATGQRSAASSNVAREPLATSLRCKKVSRLAVAGAVYLLNHWPCNALGCRTAHEAYCAFKTTRLPVYLLHLGVEMVL